MSHKTEQGLVAVDLRNESDLEAAFRRSVGSGWLMKRCQAIDVNPLIIRGDKPVAVDALVILKGK